MKALDQEAYDKLRKSGVNPHNYNAKQMRDLSVGIIEIVKSIHHGNSRLRGCEVGFGKGALICQIAQSYSMDGFETCKPLIRDVLISNFRIRMQDFMEDLDYSQFPEKYSFWIFDGLKIKKDEVKKIEQKLVQLSENGALLFFTGDSESLNNLKDMSAFQMAPSYIDDTIGPEFHKSEYDFIENNFSVFQHGYNDYKQEEEEELSIDDKLDEGESVIIDKKAIMKVSKKSDLKNFFDVLGLDYSSHQRKSLKKLKDLLIEKLERDFGV